MNNTLSCLEGNLRFDEAIKTQSINIVTFTTGQQITINRDRLPTGQTLAENITQQINNAEKVFNQFNLVKMEEVNDGSVFTDTIEVIYNFQPGQGAGNRIWQVTYACLISGSETINFISMYPDENAMRDEIHRLRHCIKSFDLHKN